MYDLEKVPVIVEIAVLSRASRRVLV